MKIKALKEADILYRDIEQRIDSIKAKKRVYTVFYRLTKVTVFMAGAAITILTGLKIEGRLDFPTENYVLVISAGVTLLAAIEGLFRFKDKGRSYDVFLFDLRRLRDRMCFDYLKDKALYEQNREIHFLKSGNLRNSKTYY
ncbi:SLATT domain-containing protein [uncultured Chryseobacterium sp.]|uniref:SLATT domain-containing protein n=1 Tax=uncultured Chryseobacterium sp. TaxID=259322 RepID=UPI0025E3C293|nr:SLATT domain-containing protein [uncultured Chryseobacterium sp.]